MSKEFDYMVRVTKGDNSRSRAVNGEFVTLDQLYQAFKERFISEQEEEWAKGMAELSAMHEKELLSKSDVLFNPKDGDIINGIKWSEEAKRAMDKHIEKKREAHARMNEMQLIAEKVSEHTPGTVEYCKGSLDTGEEFLINKKKVVELPKGKDSFYYLFVLYERVREGFKESVEGMKKEYLATPDEAIEEVGLKDAQCTFEDLKVGDYFKEATSDLKPMAGVHVKTKRIADGSPFGQGKYELIGTRIEKECMFRGTDVFRCDSAGRLISAYPEDQTELGGIDVSDRQDLLEGVWVVRSRHDLDPDKSYNAHGDTTQFPDHFRIVYKIENENGFEYIVTGPCYS